MRSHLDLLIPRVGAFALVFFVSLFAGPAAALALDPILPRLVQLFFFFWPQLALAFYGFMHPADDMTHTYLDGGWNYLIMGSFWLLIGLATSWILRNKSVGVTAMVAAPVIFAVGFALEQALYLFDVGFYYEGP